jgi:maltose alpha-D-glucosyltransferase/alpha-amylase
MRFWLELGVDGLRLDAVPYLIEREGTNNENLPETHAVLKRLRAEVDAAYPGRMLLAEANQWPEDVQHYFGGRVVQKADGTQETVGDECHMAFHFPLMPRLFMAVAQEDRFPISDILRQTPDIPANCQWAVFLRNHDELTLEMVTEIERDYLWKTYAADKRARLNIGIRRRLAPLVERDYSRLELLNSLLLSMPGTPVIYYGDEIAMGDNIYLGDRDGVRTPMQWSPDRNGGFSRADPAKLVLPPIQDPVYGYMANNVEAQQRDPHSLLNWVRRMLAVRKRFKAFGRGTIKLLYPRNRRIIAYLRQYEPPEGGPAELVLCVANLSRAAQAVELDLSQFAGRVPVETMAGSAFPPIGQLPYMLTLAPYGFHWFELADKARMPSWHAVPPEPLPEFITFVLRGPLSDLMQDLPRRRLEQEVLPLYLPLRRWFASKNEVLRQVRIDRVIPIPHPEKELMLLQLCVDTADGDVERYQLPLGLLPETSVISALPQQLALARVRNGPKVSLLTDAVTIDALARVLVTMLRSETRLPAGEGGEVRFIPTARLLETTIPEQAEIRRIAVEQSNTSLVVGDQAIVKLFRKLTRGENPEAEMSLALTERGFRNTPALFGQIVQVDADGTPTVLGVVQQFLHNQGDAWAWMQNVLQRAQRDLSLATTVGGSAVANAIHELVGFARILGARLGEMHVALAQPSDAPGFAAGPMGEAACAQLAARVEARLDEAVHALSQALERAESRLPEAAAARAQRLVQRAAEVRARIGAQSLRALGSTQLRIHGDLHLGQVLVAQDDAYLVDFEGEPARTMEERRAPSTPLRDVAGMLRSFDYAAAVAERGRTQHGTADAKLQVQALFDGFRASCAPAFLQAWRDVIEASPVDMGAAADRDAVLDLVLLERASHEIVYEATNRPDWIDVPLLSLEALVERMLFSGARRDG